MFNKQAKKDVLKTIKEMKGISTNKCGLDGDDRKFYFNTDMSVTKVCCLKRHEN